jgi:hypothetical protein
VIALAIATGIDPNAWLAMGERAIVTAWEIYRDKVRAEQGKYHDEPPETRTGQGARAPQMSG